MNVSIALGVLEQALKLWNTEEGKKYLERYIDLKNKYDEELDKRTNRIHYSQLKLDRIMRNIETIATAYTKYRPAE